MTRHKHAHTGLVTPQLPQHWLTAALRMLAMIVHNVASTLQMICRYAPVIGTQAMPSDLPQAKTDTQRKEPNPAVQHDSPKALILRDRTRSARTMELHRAIVSKDEGVLTTASYKLQPHGEPHIKASPSLRSSRRKSGSRVPRVMLAGLRTQPWIPAFAWGSTRSVGRGERAAKDAPNT